MRTFLAVLALAAATMSISPIAFGQSPSGSTSRAAIKAETRAAEKAGQLAPAGDAADFKKPTRSTSTKTRAERKTETRLARKEGGLESAGDSAELKVEAAEVNATSTKTRAQRKGETDSARKAGTLTPAGEGPGSPKK